MSFPRNRRFVGGPLLGWLAIYLYETTALMRWGALVTILAIHMLASWILLVASGETEITTGSVFFYFYAVTVSTIGYGDYSPETVGGRLALVLFVVPGGLALFGVFLGKVINGVSSQWRSALQGRKNYSHLVGHTVIFGWSPLHGPRLVRFLAEDPAIGSVDIVLVASSVSENPMPERLKFVASPSLSSADALSRSGVATAGVALVATDTDDATLTTGLAIASLPARPRIVASFDDEEKASLFERVVPNSECTVALTCETMARSARDPGTSDLQRRILSLHDDHTQFSAIVPAGGDVLYGKVFARLRSQHAATAIGMMREFGHPDVNPPDDHVLRAGDSVYYIANNRLEPDIWNALVTSARNDSP